MIKVIDTLGTKIFIHITDSNTFQAFNGHFSYLYLDRVF